MVISDSQQGCDVSALQGYEWPREVLVTVEKVVPPTWMDNTALIVLPQVPLAVKLNERATFVPPAGKFP